ncbi:3547_t:CDS:1, partial [Dentiscutata erythropus]
DDQDLLNNIMRRIEVLLGDLSKAQMEARERTTRAQQRQKDRHN